MSRFPRSADSIETSPRGFHGTRANDPGDRPASRPNSPKATIRSVLGRLGPGLVTGASDDDPSGIATYSQVGAQFGYGLLWTMLFTYPLMAAIQEISARIGRVTGCGIAANLRRHFPRTIMYLAVGAVFVANVFNLGADIGAMGAAVQLILPGRVTAYIVVFGLACLLAELFIPYTIYLKYLKWLTVSLLAYVAAAFFVHIPWGTVLSSTFLPRLQVSREYLLALMAVLGTTISPYLFIWQASQEVEEVRNNRGEKALNRAPAQAERQLGRIRTDTYVGMAVSNLVAFFIILTTAATLHAQGISNIETSTQAALALKPLAGPFAFVLFVCGIVGTGLLAVPVLAGSAAYGLGEACHWVVSLERKPKDAWRFYTTITIATVLGLLLNVLKIDPIKALFWAAVLNGVVAAPLMAVIMIMASSRKVMGKFALSSPLKMVGWVATAVMVCVCIGLFATWK
jgi:NRAMP (natural resistance-associated macrophage protein)-like metal ion transporter